MRLVVHRSWSTTVGGALVLVGSALPWLRSGARGRSSYELYGVARRLDLVGGPVGRWALAGWPLVPLLVAGAAAAAWWGWSRTSRSVAAVAALYVVAVCLFAWWAPLAALPGVVVSFGGAAVLLASAITPARVPGR